MMAVKQSQMAVMMRDVLGERYVSLELRGVVSDGDPATGRVALIASLVDGHTGIGRSVHGAGVGLVDVVFSALVSTLLSQYPSLANLRLHSVQLEGPMEFEAVAPSAPSSATAHVAVENQVGHTFRFSSSAPSITTACLQATLLAMEYFINSELTFYRVRGFLEAARHDDRPDLIERYTSMLTQLVMNSLYTSLERGAPSP